MVFKSLLTSLGASKLFSTSKVLKSTSKDANRKQNLAHLDQTELL